MAEFGISMFPTDYAIQPIELALAAEERGFESMFFPEHTHIPASRKTPWPGGAGHEETQTRHRSMLGDRARSDHARQGSRFARHVFGRARDFRNRRGME